MGSALDEAFAVRFATWWWGKRVYETSQWTQSTANRLMICGRMCMEAYPWEASMTMSMRARQRTRRAHVLNPVGAGLLVSLDHVCRILTASSDVYSL